MTVDGNSINPRGIRTARYTRFLSGRSRLLLNSTNNHGNETSPLTFRDVHDITNINLQLNGASLDPPGFYFLTDIVCIENKSIVFVKNKV